MQTSARNIAHGFSQLLLIGGSLALVTTLLGAKDQAQPTGIAAAVTEIPATSDKDSLWKSTNSGVIQTGRAEEITRGIRVEDIIEPNQDYRFAAFSKGDPFVPPPKRAVVNDEIPIVSPLQRYPLRDLNTVGVWQLPDGQRKAMIMTPKSEGIVVQIGDPIGQRRGKVLAINDDGIIIREYILAPDGTRQFEDMPLSLGESTSYGASVDTLTGLQRRDVWLGDSSSNWERNNLGNGSKSAVGLAPAFEQPAGLIPNPTTTSPLAPQREMQPNTGVVNSNQPMGGVR